MAAQMGAALISPQLDDIFKTPKARSQEHFKPRVLHHDFVAWIGQDGRPDLRKGQIIQVNDA